MKTHHPVQDGGEGHPTYAPESVPPLKAILTEPVALSIATYLWVTFLDIAFRALQPLFFATPVHLGGLGISPASIGLCLGTFGPFNGAVQGLLFPKILRHLGLKKLFLTSLLCFIPIVTMFPLINHFARERGLSPAVWASVMLQFAFNCVTDMAFGKLSSLNLCQVH